MPPLQSPAWFQLITHELADYLHSFPDDHPVHIALRTYALSLSLSLGPALVPFVVSSARVGGKNALWGILKRELGVSGFAFAMTIGVGGGTAIKRLLDSWEATDAELSLHINGPPRSGRAWLTRMNNWVSSLKGSHKTFMCNMLSASFAILLLHSGRRGPGRLPHRASIPMTVPMSSALRQGVGNNGRPSATLDLTLLLLVRAMDMIFRSTMLPTVVHSEVQISAGKEKSQKRRSITTKVDALVFWASSARIMWCFFYKPERLPRSYNKWIMSLANIDPRILDALRAIRSGAWSYSRHQATPHDLVSSLSSSLGYPASWGDVSRLPAVGGPTADAAWKVLRVKGRAGVGGIPCELVHGGVTGSSCTANAGIRGIQAFIEALAIYLPVHALPILITHPRSLLQVPTLVTAVLSIVRSAAFLSTFVSSIWFAVCFTRTLFVARMLPWIPHDFWDGPFGCAFAGSLVCGGSIWIEQGRRRGEMALYVLPRAIRALLPERWVSSGRKSVYIVERLTFILSLAALLTASSHRTDALRGLSRWTLAFIMKGPNTAFWKKKQQPIATDNSMMESSSTGSTIKE